MNRIQRRNSFLLAVTGTALLSGCGGGSGGDSSSTQPNTAPVADAGGVVIGATNNPTFVDGSASSDADNDQLSYKWEVTASPDGSAYSLSAKSSKVAQFSSDLEGEYALQLTVSDGKASATSETSVLIDQDGDGVVAGRDIDRDGDLVANDKDEFPDDRSEFADSDQNGIGNFAQKDEDGDGFPDTEDAFPFDSEVNAPRLWAEASFNDNPGEAELTNFAVPLAVSGVVEKALDGDFFAFNASAGETLTVACKSETDRFVPHPTITDTDGRTINSIKPSIAGSKWVSGTSIQVTRTGLHYLLVNSNGQDGSPDYAYGCELFYDDDLDGLSDEIELANGVNPKAQDSDQDGIFDAAEYMVPMAAGVTTPHDVDGDLVANWLDTDSDGDLIPDAVEGFSDSDKDGLGNFADLDSDNNGGLDLAEAGVNPLNPVDTDLDQTPDFADVDDDADGLTDVNDSDRTGKILKSDVLTETDPMFVSGVQSILEGGTIVEGRAVVGRNLHIKGAGFDSDAGSNIVVFRTAEETVNTPAVEVDSGRLVVPYPFEADTEVSVVTKGVATNGIDVEFVSNNTPAIDSTGLITQSPGDYITLTGENFSSSSAISVNGMQANNISSVSPSEIRFQIPYGTPDVISGQILIANSGAVSNAVPIKIIESAYVYLDIPQGSAITSSDLLLSPGTDASKDFNSFSTRIEKSATSPELVYALLKDGSGSESGVFAMGYLTPNSSSLSLSPESTAEALTLLGSGAFDRVSNDAPYTDLEDVKSVVRATPSFPNLVSLLETQMANDPLALESFNADLTMQLQLAVDDAVSAINEAIGRGDLESAQSQTTTQSDPYRIFPDEQFGIEIFAESFGPELSGNIGIENDTQLPLSVEITDKQTGRTLTPHIDDWFDQVVSTQNGFYVAQSQIFAQPQFRDASVNVITAGENSPRAANAQVARYLSVRAKLDGLSSVISTLLGVRKVDTSTLVEITLAYGTDAVFSLSRLAEGGDFNGFSKFWFNKLLLDCELRRPACAKALGAFGVGPDDLIRLLLKQNIASKVIGAIEGGTKIANLLIDVGRTPGSLDYEVRWPLDVFRVDPAKIRPDSQSVIVEVTGYGFSGYKEYIFSDPVLPRVTINDLGVSGAGAITLQASEVTPGRRIEAKLPARYLDKATGPLEVTVEHRGLSKKGDQNIEIDQALEITSLDESFGEAGKVIRIFGVGFSDNAFSNKVEFASKNGGKVAAKVITASPNRLSVGVPSSVADGPVTVTVDDETSNSLPFDVVTTAIQISFGDNGSANDDKFGLSVNGEHRLSMRVPSRRVGPEIIELSPGQHSASLRGISAPDGVGTFFIEFSGVTDLRGPATTGDNLDTGVIKTWTFTVTDGVAASSKGANTEEPEILWQE